MTYFFFSFKWNISSNSFKILIQYIKNKLYCNIAYCNLMCNLQIVESFNLSTHGKKCELKCNKHFSFSILSSLTVFFTVFFSHFSVHISFICINRMTVKISYLDTLHFLTMLSSHWRKTTSLTRLSYNFVWVLSKQMQDASITFNCSFSILKGCLMYMFVHFSPYCIQFFSCLVIGASLEIFR